MPPVLFLVLFSLQLSQPSSWTRVPLILRLSVKIWKLRKKKKKKLNKVDTDASLSLKAIINLGKRMLFAGSTKTLFWIWRTTCQRFVLLFSNHGRQWFVDCAREKRKRTSFDCYHPRQAAACLWRKRTIVSSLPENNSIDWV